MNSLLQEITILPGVFGCFIYNLTDHQITGNKMPSVFKINTLYTIGNLLDKTIQMGKLSQMSFKGVDIQSQNLQLLVTPLSNGVLLIVLCDPTANTSLINMTTGMIAANIVETLTESSPPYSSFSSDTKKDLPEQRPPRKTEDDVTLIAKLEQVKDILTSTIGPIAGPIMKECLQAWEQHSAPSLHTLPDLTKRIGEEIDNAPLEDEFLRKLKTIKW